MSKLPETGSPRRGTTVAATSSSEPSPGKRTLVEQAYRGVVQRSNTGAGEPSARIDEETHVAAARGIASPSSSLPHADRIQRLFGRHDISSIQAHVGGRAESAANQIGAAAYATGNHVVLGKGTDLFTAAHEAAHVVQQRSSMQLKGGVGSAGDAHEQHADAVAARVVAGQSAEGLLEQYAGQQAGTPQVQRQHAETSGSTLNPSEHKVASGKDMFKQASGNVVKAGSITNVDAITSGDKVIVHAPGVSMVGTFALKPDVDPDPPTVDVGWVQTVTNSERIGVYRKDGTVQRKDVTAFASARDSRLNAPAPWYEPPSQITKTHRSAFPIAEDQPKMELPTTLSDARLTEIEGADHFKASLSFGSGSTVEHVQTFAWGVPWNVVIDQATGAGTGGPVSIPSPAPYEAPTSNRPANEIGNDPANHVQTYETEAAAVEGIASKGLIPFITELPKHKEKAPSSYWNMVGALWKSAARVHVKFTPKDDPPDVKVEFHSDKTVDAGSDKGDREYSALAHMVYDPAAIGPGHSILVMVNGVSQISLTWPYRSAKMSDVSWIKPGLLGNTEYHYDLEAWLK